MATSTGLIAAAAFALAAGASLVGANYAVKKVEEGTEIAIRRALDTANFVWAEVQADGLRVVLSGTAPDEATRFDVLSTAGRVVDAARVIDQLDVADATEIAPPRFSVEILRNESGISLIGLIPASTDRDALRARLDRIETDTPVADFLETADYPVPDDWDVALDYALVALAELSRSKISVAAGDVQISAMTDSPEIRTRVETTLMGEMPDGVEVSLNISAPRPVIAPFTLRYVLDSAGGRFDACSAPDEDSAANILAAARAAGLSDPQPCTIGLGVPSPNWSTAAALSLAALPRLGGGTVTMTDTDIALAAAEAISPSLFDEVIGELETALPPVFTLYPTLPAAEGETAVGPPEFYATLSPEGLVQLRGRLPGPTARTLAESFARARFGSEQVYTATRQVADLPPDWTTRALAALEALGHLENGVVTVSEEEISVSGISHNEDAPGEVARLFAAKLGETAQYDLAITYRAPPPPKNLPLSSEVCESRVHELLAENKISFEPGSATIDEESVSTVEAIAEVLDRCPGIPLEIQGHTDSQGREVMNLELSQDRANAVLAELNALRIRTASFRAVGYGEAQPIADNKTEDGREANRRIEFHLIRTDSSAEDETTLDSLSADPAEPPTEDQPPETSAETSAEETSEEDSAEESENEQN